jgi:very-short-patch-repair endonuclease
MFLAYEGKLKDFSRELRTHMTDAEKILWLKLRRKQLKGYQFYRQKIVGDYIVDFYCPGARLSSKSMAASTMVSKKWRKTG